MTSGDGQIVARRSADPSDEVIEGSQARPRRGQSVRGRAIAGVAALVTSVVAIGGITLASLSGAAQATSPGGDAVVAPFDRGSDTSRSDDREALDPAAVSNLIADRQAALTDVDKTVAGTQAAASSDERTKYLTTTQKSITTEAARLKEELNKLVFPAQGKPGSPWGMRLHPILGYYRMHWGMDIGAACGSPLKAVYDGTVTVATFGGASGNHVKIDHGLFRGKKLETNSLHMTRYIVASGDQVKKGQIIGYTGSTGMSTECHLHLETVWGGTNVDPATLFANP